MEAAVEGVEVSEVEVADAGVNGAEAVAIEVEEDAVVVEFDGVSLVDLQMTSWISPSGMVSAPG